MVSQFLLIQALLGEHDSAEANFWWFFIPAVGFLVAYLIFSGKNFWLSILSNVACVFIIFLYFSETSLDHYWFLEKAEPLEWIGLVFAIMVFLAACFAMAKSHVFMIKHIADAPVYSLICLVIGLAWFFTWFFAACSLMIDHFGAALLALIVSVPSGSAAPVPTIYVEGEGYVNVPGYKGGNRATSDYGKNYRSNDRGEWSEM